MIKIIYTLLGTRSSCFSFEMMKTLFYAILIASTQSIQMAQAFTDVATVSGITHLSTSAPETDTGGGAAWIDIDNDGYQDLYVPNPVVGASWLYHNIPGKNGERVFIEIANLPGSGAHNSAYASTGVSVGDIDNDGCDDLFVTNGGNASAVTPIGAQRNTLLRNNYCDNGSLTFTDITVSVNLHIEKLNSMVSAFGDLDEDGDLDLYVGNYIPDGNMSDISSGCDKNKFYLNNGNNTFSEISTALAVDDRGCTLGVVLTDYNNDGLLDIYVANDFTDKLHLLDTSDHFYKNTGPDTNGLPTFIRDIQSQLTDAANGMGIAIGDYDKDGDLDYYTTSFGASNGISNILNKNLGVSQSYIFENIGLTSGVSDPGQNPSSPEVVCLPGDTLCSRFTISWGAAFFDVENDGDLDLYKASGLVQGAFSVGTTMFPNRLFANDGLGNFTDQATSLNTIGILDPSVWLSLCGDPTGCFDQSRGVAIADYDNDGDIDIFVVNTASATLSASVPAQPRLYRNNTINNGISNGNRWLELVLTGTQSNHRGIGAKVRVSSTSVAGTITQMQEVHAGSSHGSTNAFPVHFGFPSGSYINSLAVEWPSDHVDIYTRSDIPLNKKTLLIEAQGVVLPPSIATVTIDVFGDVSQPAVWGSFIQLKGSDFCVQECYSSSSSETIITLGETRIQPLWVTENLITFRIPDGLSGTFPITVTTMGQVSAPSLPLSVDGVVILTMGTIGHPLDAAKVGGLFVATGKNFCISLCGTTMTGTTVSFGGVTVVPTYVDAKTLAFNIPETLSGIKARMVINVPFPDVVISSAPSAQQLTVVPSEVVISSVGKLGGGDVVTAGNFVEIIGSGFCVAGSEFCPHFSREFPDGLNPQVDVRINGVTTDVDFVSSNGGIIFFIVTDEMTSGLVEVITPWGVGISNEVLTIQ